MKFVIICLSFLIASCTGVRKTSSDNLVVALSSLPATLDPRFATDAGGVRITGLLFSSLVQRDSSLHIVGDAAESWTLLGNTYTFLLKPGLKFSDGMPLTTEDLEFTFQEYLKPNNPYRSSLEPMAKFEARYDDKERFVKIEMKEFNATFLGDLGSIQFLPKKVVLKLGEDFGKSVVGSGPYRFVSQSSNEIKLEARTDHPYLKPKTPNLTFKIVRDDYTRFLKVYKGEIDIVQSDMPLARVETLEKKGDFQVFKFPGLSMTYILVNHQDPLLKDLKIRQAISNAINRPELIRYKLENLAQPATSIVTPVNPFFDATLVAPAFDLEAARKTFRELGVSGKEITLKTSNAATAIENGKVISNQIQTAGLGVKMQSYEWGTFYGDIKKGNFQIATMKWVGTVDPDIYRSSLHSKETPENSGRNRGRYKNPKLDELLDAGLRIKDEKARIRHYHQIQKLVLEEMPIIPLWYEMEVAIAHKRVKDYTPPRDGSFHGLIDVRKE